MISAYTEHIYYFAQRRSPPSLENPANSLPPAPSPQEWLAVFAVLDHVSHKNLERRLEPLVGERF